MRNEDATMEPIKDADLTNVTIDIISAERAAEKLRAMGMRISPDTVRRGVQQGVFPFGDVIDCAGGVRCYVYTKLLEKWIKERL